MKNTGRYADILLIIFLCVCLIFFSVGMFLLSSQDRFSAVENRPLASLPHFSAESFFDRSFTDELSRALRDSIPFRNFFLAIRGYSDILLRGGQVENVIFGKDGYLLPRGEYENLIIFEKNVVFFDSLTSAAKEMGISTAVAIVPRPIDVSANRLPTNYGGSYGDVWEALGDRLGGRGLCEYLEEQSAQGKDVWYKTDHHWTSLGAYYAYAYLGRSLGYEPLSIEYFEREKVSDDFLGSSYSLTGGVAFSNDEIELFRYEGDDGYNVVADGEKLSGGLYEFKRLETRDKYGIFLGGNYGRVTIEGNREREKLLIIKDSYANSLVPFLARHFDIELIDLRYFSGDNEELHAAIDNADRLLILQGADTLATTGMFFEY